MGRDSPLGLCYSLIIDCKELINRQGWDVVIKKIFGEANACTNYMANLGITLGGGSQCFVDPPKNLLNLLINDLARVSRPRLIND